MARVGRHAAPMGTLFSRKNGRRRPGVLFYVYVFLFKITPFTLVGLGLIATALLFRIKPLMPPGSWRPIVILGFFVVVYTAGMVAGQRKFDRYILPDFLFLDLFAAIGIVGVARHFIQVGGRVAGCDGSRHRRAGGRASSLGNISVSVSIGLFQSDARRREIRRGSNHGGWGEGQDQAAYILSQPGGDVARGPDDESAGIDVVFPSWHRHGRRAWILGANQESILMWANTDYVVTHILQWQRDMAGLVDQFVGDLTPVQTVKIDGIPFVKVYDLRSVPPPLG